MLEADDEIVGIADDDHAAAGFPPSPALGPEVEHVVQVDIGEQRREDALNAKGNFGRSAILWSAAMAGCRLAVRAGSESHVEW